MCEALGSNFSIKGKKGRKEREKEREREERNKWL